jgi:hypothetical protein
MSTIKNYGREEDRTREQFTAQILRHPEGEPATWPGYVADIIANVRANSLGELQQFVADFVWENTP